jgi:hypothetical protein
MLVSQKISEAEKEMNRIKTLISGLTVKEIVILPGIFFLIAILGAEYGVYGYMTLAMPLYPLWSSALAITVGVVLLIRELYVIEKSALQAVQPVSKS